MAVTVAPSRLLTFQAKSRISQANRSPHSLPFTEPELQGNGKLCPPRKVKANKKAEGGWMLALYLERNKGTAQGL